ncbi:hypothetical protein [Pseudomonas sp. B35(2017)]|uniref:hypothetical protein n=1 Tax=Pseudomonas sp. B35(2017) TaxID=1981722 RepID=UPI000A1EDF9F|nr:hypothetical protein [Pseudomonas sp. B35(2017)]
MKEIEIHIIKNNKKETAQIKFDRRSRTLIFTMSDGSSKTCTGDDLYVCFGTIRAYFPDIIFLCKGARINVHPSRMTSQMSSGLVAYELKIGLPTEEDDIVRIFDYEEKDLTNDIKIQQEHYLLWIKSLSPNG